VASIVVTVVVVVVIVVVVIIVAVLVFIGVVGRSRSVAGRARAPQGAAAFELAAGRREREGVGRHLLGAAAPAAAQQAVDGARADGEVRHQRVQQRARPRRQLAQEGTRNQPRYLRKSQSIAF
jgi:hypothetical protein